MIDSLGEIVLELPTEDTEDPGHALPEIWTFDPCTAAHQTTEQSCQVFQDVRDRFLLEELTQEGLDTHSGGVWETVQDVELRISQPPFLSLLLREWGSGRDHCGLPGFGFLGLGFPVHGFPETLDEEKVGILGPGHLGDLGLFSTTLEQLQDFPGDSTALPESEQRLLYRDEVMDSLIHSSIHPSIGGIGIRDGYTKRHMTQSRDKT